MEKKQGVLRLLYACKYSWQGLQSALLNEEAFRQEFIIISILTIVSLFFNISGLEHLALIASLIFVLIVELLNSAIECVVDRISLENHMLSGRAKDYGSLAVLLSLVIACSTWWLIL
tara:strand:+ start:2408 stop:2758 length:351 start_codon:yes stop_codon:yes gene_type:complete